MTESVLMPAEKTDAQEYPQALHRPGLRWWRGVLAIVMTIVLYLVCSTLFNAAALLFDNLTGTRTPGPGQAGVVQITPATLLALNLTGAVLIPIAMLVQRLLFGARPRTLTSVTARFRWRLLGRAAIFVVPLWLVYVVVTTLLGPPLRWNVSIPMLIIVLATTWLQAAGEEYGFRGIITRSIGSWFGNPTTALVVAIIGANLLFMAAHLALDPWLIVYYFVFGVCCSVISWSTGGLEVNVLVHAVNNTLLFVLTGLTSGGAFVINRSDGAGGPIALVPIGMMIMVAVVVSLWARRTGVQRAVASSRESRV